MICPNCQSLVTPNTAHRSMRECIKFLKNKLEGIDYAIGWKENADKEIKMLKDKVVQYEAIVETKDKEITTLKDHLRRCSINQNVSKDS